MVNDIAIRLKRLRQQAGITGRELARRVNVAQSYVSKIENGLIHPNADFCKAVANALNLTADETRSLLSLLSLYQAEHHPLSRRTNALEERQGAIRQLESDASVIRVYQPVLIPGLLQTRQYMKAIFSRYDEDPHQIDLAINGRIERQHLLMDEGKKFQFLFTANSLQSNICSKHVLEAQIRALRRLVHRTNLTITYLPSNIEFPPRIKIPMSGFEALDDSIVIVDTLVGFMAFRHPDEIKEYLLVFDRLEAVGLRGEAMFDAIANCVAN